MKTEAMVEMLMGLLVSIPPHRRAEFVAKVEERAISIANSARVQRKRQAKPRLVVGSLRLAKGGGR